MGVHRGKSGKGGGNSTRISLLKGIGIFLVVSGHAYIRVDGSYRGAVQIAVFFWVIGYSYDYAKYACNTARLIGARLHKFMVPYIGYMVCFTLLHNFFCSIGILQESYFENAQDYLNAFFGYFTLNYNETICGPMWFMAPYLIAIAFFGNIVYFINLRFKSESNRLWFWVIVISGLLGIIGIIMVENKFYTGYRYEVALLMLPVIAAGKVAGIKGRLFQCKAAGTVAAILALGVIKLSYLQTDQIIILGQREILNPVFFYPVVLCGIYFTFWLSDVLSGLGTGNILMKAFKEFGDYSLDIMILHVTIFRGLYVIDHRWCTKQIVDYSVFVRKHAWICMIAGLVLPVLIRKAAHVFYKWFIKNYEKKTS